MLSLDIKFTLASSTPSSDHANPAASLWMWSHSLNAYSKPVTPLTWWGSGIWASIGKTVCPHVVAFTHYFGSLTGSVDYYTYGSCDGKSLCGFDLHEGESVAWGKGGKYSTHLYTQRVRKILATHDSTSQPLFIFLSLQAVHTP